MIEGGSKILSAFLRAPPREDGSPLVDNVIVTVAPMFIGDGIGVVPDVSALSPQIPADTSQEDRDSLPTLKTSYTEAMGKDAVMVCTIAPR
jgi:2,5-diamino-6-(ribosylamino)-4(3H)-pyrimidinone 5'-phosphate reductase